MKPTLKIRQRVHSLELLMRLSDKPTCAVELMLELSWSPEWLDEQIAELRRRSIKVRRGESETLAVSAPCWPRAKKRADAYRRAMGYSGQASATHNRP